MSLESYRFGVGDFNCIAISDGSFTYSPPFFPPSASLLFANAPKELVSQTLREHELQADHWVEWTSPYICVVLGTNKHRVLVDTGAGSLGPNTGRLLSNLQTEGIAPKDIDTVILTHGHPDHTGGNILRNGESAFPNARFFMWREEWDYWTSEPKEMRADEHVELLFKFARRNLPPIRGQLDFVDHEVEIVPGVLAFPASGHTLGHMALAVSSGGEELLCIADAMLHPIHVQHPEWYAVVDASPQQVVITRRRLLKRAEMEKALVLGFHFPFPGLGHIVKGGEGWCWKPISP